MIFTTLAFFIFFKLEILHAYDNNCMLLLQKFDDVDTDDVPFVTKVIYVTNGNGMTILSVFLEVLKDVLIKGTLA